MRRKMIEPNGRRQSKKCQIKAGGSGRGRWCLVGGIWWVVFGGSGPETAAKVYRQGRPH